MVRAEDYPPITVFSRAFSAALAVDMKDHGVTHQAVADLIGRSRPFVSDQVRGKRPVDTDVMAAVAQLSGVRTPVLVRRVLANVIPDLRDQSALEAWLAEPPEAGEDATLGKAARNPGRPPSLSEDPKE